MTDDDHDPGPCVERRHLGHLLRGLTFLTLDGVETCDAFFVCGEMDSMPAEVLAQIHAEDRAIPPLDYCGRRHLDH